MINTKKPDTRQKETTFAPMQGKKRGGGKRIMSMRKDLNSINGTFKTKYNHLCNLVADEERYWWINSWLKAYPPTPGGGK